MNTLKLSLVALVLGYNVYTSGQDMQKLTDKTSTAKVEYTKTSPIEHIKTSNITYTETSPIGYINTSKKEYIETSPIKYYNINSRK